MTTRSEVTTGRLARIAIALVFACAFPAHAEVAPAMPPACATGRAVALQTDGDTPVVLLDSGALLASGSSPADVQCTGVRDAVGLAIDASGTRFLADRSTVHVVPRGAATPVGAFTPQLAPGDAIVAIALLPNGDVELASVGGSSSAGEASRAVVHLGVYSARARGDATAPVRAFSTDALRGAPSAIALDSRGRTYVYDDGGEIAVFAADASGHASPVRSFFGPLSGLRPAVHASPRGSRPLALDLLGTLYAADDGAIVRFPFSDDGQLPQSYPYASEPKTHLGLIRGLATDRGSVVYALSVDPASGAYAICALPEFAPAPPCSPPAFERRP